MSSRTAVLPSLLLLAVGGGTPAQTSHVIPAGLGSVEGQSYTYTPAGRAPSRSQFVYGQAALPAAPVAIRLLRMRRDGDYSSTYEGHSFGTSVWLANREKGPADGCSGLFADNRGPDFTQAMAERSIYYPPLAKPAAAPAAFSQEFALDRPFHYLGKALVVEFVVGGAAAVSKRWYPDAETYSWTGTPGGGSRTYSGKGCPEAFLHYGASPHIGQGLYHYGYSQAVGRKCLALDLIGVSDRAHGPVGLPLDLAPAGAPGCNLYASVQAVVPAYTDETSSAGYVRFELGGIPNAPALVGAVFFEQQAVLDPQFNGLGLRLSRLAACRVGQGFTGTVECLHLYGYGERFDLASAAATGFEAKGLVLELVE